MKLINNPDKFRWKELIKRPYSSNDSIRPTVEDIIKRVEEEGDSALLQFTQKFDSPSLQSIIVTEEEIKEAESLLSAELKKAIDQAYTNIYKFHQAQVREEPVVLISEGIKCWRKMVAIEKVGLYIPGGTAPLFSTVLMLAIPAKIAGCSQVMLCTPANREGKIHPAILYTAALSGITRIFKLGGAQAIAALALGTETVPAVYKIFGPGNQFVTLAKQLVQQKGIAIDMPAGPSEVLVLADETANPSHVASDLLSQAEHGMDSQSVLITTSSKLGAEVLSELEKQTAKLGRKEIVEGSLKEGRIIVFNSREDAVLFVNEYAAEHLIINCRDEEFYLQRVINAGSIFLGPYSPESAGDYASGTNHTLPTNGFARAYSGVSVDSFVKKITVQKLSKEGLQSIAETVITMAEAEGLDAHAEAIRCRLT